MNRLIAEFGTVGFAFHQETILGSYAELLTRESLSGGETSRFERIEVNRDAIESYVESLEILERASTCEDPTLHLLLSCHYETFVKRLPLIQFCTGSRALAPFVFPQKKGRPRNAKDRTMMLFATVVHFVFQRAQQECLTTKQSKPSC
jgi:hypothetical protein